MKVLDTLNQKITQILYELGINDIEIDWEHPQDNSHGDYATSIALKLVKQTKEFDNPRKLASVIVAKLNADLPQEIEKIKVAGPGFINISLNQIYYNSQLRQILDLKQSYGSSQLLKDKKISVEYTDPNPFKEFHIGHLYSNLIGESLSKILEFNGATVWRADFYGDVGMHVAKSVWGIIKLMKREKVTLDDLNVKSVKERQQFLGRGYALGSNTYEENDQAVNEINELNYYIYVAGQEALIKNKSWKPIVDYRKFIKDDEERLKEIQSIYEAGLSWSLEYFETIYQRLGTKFDGYYPESWTGELGMEVVRKGLEKGILEKNPEGTVIYRGEKDNLHTRVFVNKLGLPTYEAKDLGLAQAKYQDFQYDLSINIFGNEIDEYYKVVKAAMVRIDPSLGNKASHIAHGMVNLPEGKMSSRTGNVITANDLLDQTKNQVQLVMADSILSDYQKDDISESVAQAAVKYAFLKSNIGTNITFDIGSSVNFEGNSGPYIQYTHARCASVLEKAANQNISWDKSDFSASATTRDEIELYRLLPQFPEVVLESAQEYSPHKICTYLHQLAQSYNTFYNSNSILKAKNEKQKVFRLILTAATAQVIKNGLYLLGITAPGKM